MTENPAVARPEPKFLVSPDNHGESISVECDLCAYIEEWREAPVDFGDLTRWVSEHRRAHWDAWEAQQREAGQVFYAHYFRYHSEYKDEYFSAEDAARALVYGEENGELSAKGVIMPDGTTADHYLLVGDRD